MDIVASENIGLVEHFVRCHKLQLIWQMSRYLARGDIARKERCLQTVGRDNIVAICERNAVTFNKSDIILIILSVIF